ncbi:SIMPL domain-containing protein [Candidatus Parcubacteria bacterium]|nr:SIMPL domain-containing protein [Candidatus Parcubacteria bacterium]
MDNITNHPAVKNLAIALLALLVIFTAAKTISEFKSMNYIGAGVSATNAISVSGKGEVIAAPDIALFSFTVEKEGASVPDAQKKATDNMNAILDYLKKSGVADKDVKTTSYNIYPRFEYTGTSSYGGGKQILAAYVVSQTIEVKVRKLDDAGKILSGIGEYGATGISGLNFTNDKQDDLVRQARDKAIADAREQANVLARSLGVSIVRIVNFSESGSGYPQPIYYAKDVRNMGMGGAAEQSAPSIPSGENKIVSNVMITYEIK